jgi:hypothetical protein
VAADDVATVEQTGLRGLRDGMRLQIRTPGDLNTLEFVACERIPPGLGQIEVSVSASSINFADVLLAIGRSPESRGTCRSQVWISPMW